MVKLLLSCDADDFDIALDLQSVIQEELGYKVMLDVDDWKQQENDNQSLNFADDFDNKLEGAAVLLVFEFGESSVSAWVMLEEADERDTRNANPRKSWFPECINFEPSFSRGLRIFQKILQSDFGLITRPRSDYIQPLRQ
mmetsp:Transcript_40656/g.98237  ORF Transcript_40656/g.98237 Transcript_40656/m.98237 type:complete len:140 (+) Transcript_40656:27-446(+)|eukprot:CAMPEP_0113615962 /NCGR_PEP_ID=MMETSP0017_2-20120614/7981_1 /TAXON_ID=2856 /ORGANISM="Cylindrotheca closterium" /LENGTH=139 /DNA_ID=CAMNT_0000525235 /DNA_START=44 /DNA_END=463 /DNA_ORIENTATION=+ /assembly_acc=CAM_ASM_000147